MPLLTEDLRRFLEGIFEESVVPLLRDGELWATGFFVSADGLVCSCHHGLFPGSPGRVEMRWRGETHPLSYLPEESSPASDFALFRADFDRLGVERTVPVPVDAGDFHPRGPGGAVVALGYAGMTDPLAPLRLRAFDGAVTAAGGDPGKLETIDITVGKGNSGAPILDLRRFRVVGYVQGKTEGVWERMGHAVLLGSLLGGRPRLRADWDAAGERFDAGKRRFFRERGQSLPPELLTAGDARALAAEHDGRLIAALERAGIYNADLFVTRGVSRSVDRFLESPEPPVALLAGQSGTGKTNVLVDVCRRAMEEGAIVLLALGSALDATDSFDSLPARLQIAGDLQAFLRRLAPERVLLILDGYNEWAPASRAHLLRLLDRAGELAREGLPLKVLLGIKTEFLREHLHELFATGRQDGEGGGSSLPVDLLFHDREATRIAAPGPGETVKRRRGPQRPFIEVPTLDSGDEASAEQEALYEHYRTLGRIRDAAGQQVGIRPLDAYDEIPEAVRRLLDRPLLLRQFMIRYHGRRVPASGLRSALFREILTPDISRFAPSWITREAVEVLLGNLARHFSRLGVSALPFRRLVREPWFDRPIVELLLAHTFFLARSPTPGSLAGGSALGFSSEWLFEYYLALDLWEDLAITESRVDFLNESLRSAAEASTVHVTGALTFLGEWALAGDHGILRDLLAAASGEDLPSLRSAFVASFFEFVRVHYGFVRPLPPEVQGAPSSFAGLLLAWHQQLGRACLRHVLRYLERLGDRGLTDSLDLLRFDDALWENLGTAWREEVVPVRALKIFRMDSAEHVREAMAELATIDRAAAPPEKRSLIAFVTGRCHQWFQDYAAALAAYEECRDAKDQYGAMCRHQIAFIRYFHHSDYRGAAALLAESVAPDRKASGRSASSLLYAGCLIELGRFQEARELLLGLVRGRHPGLGRARALRALANLYYRTFETDLAIEAAEQAVRLSRDHENQLPHAESCEVLAATLACHQGEIQAALDLIARSLAVARDRRHQPSISWFAQTQGLIHALARQSGEMEEALGLAADAGLTPNQVRRSGLIRVLDRFLAHRGTEQEPRPAEIAGLRRDYESAGQSWYVALLDLVVAAVEGRPVAYPVALFPPGTSAEGLQEAYLLRVLTVFR